MSEFLFLALIAVGTAVWLLSLRNADLPKRRAHVQGDGGGAGYYGGGSSDCGPGDSGGGCDGGGGGGGD